MKNKHIYITILVGIIAFVIGWTLNGDDSTSDHNHEQENIKTEIYTCSMHPQIRQNEPGKCPICGMDLIPVSGMGNSSTNIEMSEQAVKLAEIMTSKVELSKPEKQIDLQGKIKIDERNIAVISSRVAGRIEKLYVDFTGKKVNKGDKLAAVYSPQLVTAQQELFEALKYKDTNPILLKAAKAKLKLWDISDVQIEQIISNGKPQTEVDILATQSGIVTKRNIALGDYVKEGHNLFEVANLTNVWVVFDAYEMDLPWIKENDKITFTIPSIPNKKFTSKIAFIDPIIDNKTRTASIRVNVNNSDTKLKPEMFANGTVNAKLPIKEAKLIIPKSAVLWTGKRSVVYVKLPNSSSPTFQFREITTGLDLGNYLIIESGLKEGEEIVTHGTFKVDAAAQLAGKQSMMNNEVSNHTSFSTTDKFKHNLTALYQEYLSLKDALVESNIELANKKSSVNLSKLKVIKSDDLDEKGRELWNGISGKMQKALLNIEQEKDIKIARKQFKELSENLLQAIESFGVHGVVIYADYCPMAVEDEGALWLSDFEEIKNPYFGESMLKCGEVKKIIKGE